MAQLQSEVRQKGWIAYGARSKAGDWDLFLCRPDGSESRALTSTPEWNEFSPQFSRDGRRLLYRRIPRDEAIDDNRHGEQGELVLANADGSAPVALAKTGELTWASFSPDGAQIASLSIKGISFINLATRQVVRTLPRQGFFQQMTWSPDGKWLVGVANSFGASWSIARMDAATGEASAVNRVDCCTPDWFPDSSEVIFSWRPPGQEANNGYGWTQLWRAAADASSHSLVYAEEGRHAYGGNVSPDGRYVLFTGNMEEDGDPGHAGGPMALMRLSDAPIIRSQSAELRALYPAAKEGPVLDLPAGWEPCWTGHEVAQGAAGEAHPDSAARNAAFMRQGHGNSSILPAEAGVPGAVSGLDRTSGLAGELHDRGWLVFSAMTDAGDWDLFLARPDGSDRHPITQTPQFSETGPRFSPDGTRLLYYRQPKSEPVDNNTYGTFDLVLANADGSNPEVLGNAYRWASWGPDGRQIACLAPKTIQVVDLAARKVLREFPRKGIVQQLILVPRRPAVRRHRQRPWPVLEHRRARPRRGPVARRERDGPLQLHAGLVPGLAARGLCPGHHPGKGRPRRIVGGERRWQRAVRDLRRAGPSYLRGLRLSGRPLRPVHPQHRGPGQGRHDHDGCDSPARPGRRRAGRATRAARPGSRLGAALDAARHGREQKVERGAPDSGLPLQGGKVSTFERGRLL